MALHPDRKEARAELREADRIEAEANREVARLRIRAAALTARADGLTPKATASALGIAEGTVVSILKGSTNLRGATMERAYHHAMRMLGGNGSEPRARRVVR